MDENKKLKENQELNDGQFNANCYCCNKDFIAEGLLGGKCVCNKCYPIWYKGIECIKEENEKLKERQSIMAGLAMTHIQEMNETHQKYGDMVRKLKSRKMYKDLREEIKELKKEIEELKEEVNTLECKNADSENVFFDMYGKLEIWGIMEDITPKFMEMWNIVIKRYVKLQEELCLSNTNEKINKCIEVQRLKEELQKSNNHRDHRLHNKLKKENKELNDKYEELLKNSFQTESDDKEQYEKLNIL